MQSTQDFEVPSGFVGGVAELVVGHSMWNLVHLHLES